jgi:hypothetical protein
MLPLAFRACYFTTVTTEKESHTGSSLRSLRLQAAVGRRRFSLQQPLEQVVQEQAVRSHTSEFHPRSFAGGDITHNRLGLNKASGNLKKQRQFGAHWPYMV